MLSFFSSFCLRLERFSNGLVCENNVSTATKPAFCFVFSWVWSETARISPLAAYFPPPQYKKRKMDRRLFCKSVKPASDGWELFFGGPPEYFTSSRIRAHAMSLSQWLSLSASACFIFWSLSLECCQWVEIAVAMMSVYVGSVWQKVRKTSWALMTKVKNIFICWKNFLGAQTQLDNRVRHDEYNIHQ